MSIKYQIAGSATINGIIMINAAEGRVVRAVRSFDGTVSVKKPALADKSMFLYKSRIERPASKIPVMRELFKILLMFIIVISSFAAGAIEIFKCNKRWSVKRVVSLIIFSAGMFVLVYSDSYPAIAALIVLIIYFRKGIAEILKYHGAEHKCINMYESANSPWDITIESARAFSRIHTRCGTNIIFLLIPASVIYYFAGEQAFALMASGSIYDFIGSLLLLGICIELFKLFQKPLMRFMLKPGMFLQRFVTTKEPEDAHLEVALKALEAVVEIGERSV